MPFALPFETYYKKLLACYTGKAIGGTLGMPFEGKTDTSRITYYDPVPTAMVGNDDIDLQVVWVDCLRRNGFPVNRKHLADSWKHVHFGPDEYAVTIYLSLIHIWPCSLFPSRCSGKPQRQQSAGSSSGRWRPWKNPRGQYRPL